MRCNATALSQALHADLSEYIDVQLPSWAPDSTATQVACYAIRDSFMKKFMETDEPSTTACAAALKKFLAVNKRCGEWSIPYEYSSDEELVEGVKNSLYDFWYRSDGCGNQSPLINDFRELFARGGVGPGANINARDTDFYTKMFDSDLSGTGDLPQLWERCISQKGLWDDAHASNMKVHRMRVVETSSYSFVNKTTKIARGICTEPTINMWFQKGAGAILEDRLSSFYGIRLNTQPDRNSALARLGSIDGSFATIDLESASDSLSVNVLREILPRGMFSTLMSLRTPVTKLPTGERVALNMISTMGNGFNFPLQTCLFSAIVHSVYRYIGLRKRRERLKPFKCSWLGDTRYDYGVFGDDIIVDTRACRLTLRVLYLLGFVVNTDKTFIEGRFRESCGSDYVDGVNVRGVYCKSLKTEQDLFATINSLNMWSTKTGVILSRTVACLVKGVRDPHKRFVPPDEDASAGIFTPVEYASSYKKTRNGRILYYPRVPREWQFHILGDVVWTYKEQVRRNYNPSGLLIAFLAGGIRGYSVTLRQRVVRYKTKQKWTPNWGYFSPRPLEHPPGFSRCRQFVDACNHNFVNCEFWRGG